MRRGLIGGAVLAVLWFLGLWVPYVLSMAGGSLATLAQLIPSPGGRGVLGSPVAWMVLAQVLLALVLVAGFAVLAPLLSTGRVAFAPAWLAAILVAFAIGSALDLGSFVVWAGRFGIRGAVGTMGATSMTTWWAVLVGWLPALVWVRTGRRDAVREPAGAQRRRSTAVAVVAVVALLALPVVSESGQSATQGLLRDEAAADEARAEPDGAAAPDASAPGDPVPTVAPGSAAAAEGACTADDTTIMAPAPDGATGHRGQSLLLVNVSEEPCTVEGYPDVAYGDQNGHVLDAAVEHGGSFMAEDPGPAPLTLQPGDSASAVIGWDANSVHGQLAARSVWIAVAPGEERLSWDMALDIVSGATVRVTAWQFAPTPPG